MAVVLFRMVTGYVNCLGLSARTVIQIRYLSVRRLMYGRVHCDCLCCMASSLLVDCSGLEGKPSSRRLGTDVVFVLGLTQISCMKSVGDIFIV
jgi:hypothetical protein